MTRLRCAPCGAQRCPDTRAHCRVVGDSSPLGLLAGCPANYWMDIQHTTLTKPGKGSSSRHRERRAVRARLARAQGEECLWNSAGRSGATSSAPGSPAPCRNLSPWLCCSPASASSAASRAGQALAPEKRRAALPGHGPAPIGQLASKPATRSRNNPGVTSAAGTAWPATRPTRLNKPRRNGLTIALPLSIREK
jgi:hypothetical protein